MVHSEFNEQEGLSKNMFHSNKFLISSFFKNNLVAFKIRFEKKSNKDLKCGLWFVFFTNGFNLFVCTLTKH